ncbi:type II toxin-antitoxin system VapC family toxin [Pseudonocardia nantongensis]|uniref:type II toxin-antitoxin system VapC family toxin n=1 Tax=Pseudonocardia nantongensis TaxID=1181885 RepID=UPI00397DA607
MIVFADSSALVKLYADEERHDRIRSLDTLAVSAIARVEVPAALWRKHRIGQLTAADTAVLIAAFDSDYFGSDRTPPRFAAVAVTATVLDDAARCAAVHGLPTYDAVQLAGARATADVEPDCTTFAAFDRELRAAAAAEGFAVVPA